MSAKVTVLTHKAKVYILPVHSEKGQSLLHSAYDSSILSVIAVVHCTMCAVNESGLCPSAEHIVQENASSALSKIRVSVGNRTCTCK